MQVVTIDDAPRKEIATPQYLSIINSFYGAVASMQDGPQVYLVNLPQPGSTIDPHFHDVDQYQVIVQGGGRLGPGQAGPVAFHYADAYTPYGPIVGGVQGISFFTIRPACATGYFPMPQSRHLMPGRPGRNIGGQFDIDMPLPAPNQSTRETLLEAPEDNTRVVGLRLGPNAACQGEPTTGGDQYYLVCTGSLQHQGRQAGPMTLVRLARGEPTTTLRAGPEGAAVLMLQLPMPTARVGSDPKPVAKRNPGDYKLPEGSKMN